MGRCYTDARWETDPGQSAVGQGAEVGGEILTRGLLQHLRLPTRPPRAGGGEELQRRGNYKWLPAFPPGWEGRKTCFETVECELSVWLPGDIQKARGVMRVGMVTSNHSRRRRGEALPLLKVHKDLSHDTSQNKNIAPQDSDILKSLCMGQKSMLRAKYTQ